MCVLSYLIAFFCHTQSGLWKFVCVSVQSPQNWASQHQTPCLTHFSSICQGREQLCPFFLCAVTLLHLALIFVTYFYWVGQKVHFFFHMIALVVLSCLQLHLKQFCYIVLWQLSHQCALQINLLKLVNFGVAILILKMEENKQHFWHIMLYYLMKGKNATAMRKKICAVHMEKVLWLTKHVKSGLRSFVLEISRWMMMPQIQ